jgi:RNA polymerase sigma factor (sigma-70 family)
MRTIDVRTDDELVTAAAGGSRTAFEELYRRHSDAAWGVAMSVTRDRNDAADAVSDAFTRMFSAVEAGRLVGVPFRPYLLTATRNASIDILRRSSRVDPTDDIDDARLPRTREVATPADAVMLGAETALVAQAFADLPERWRSVLWLTEVEGMAPREAAEVLGLSANGAAQLAVRARAGLRERYLQAHIGTGVASNECRFTLDRLGAYVGGALSARDLAKVDQHLAGCDDCRARCDELEEVGSTLRRAIVPIPLFLGAAIFGRMQLASAATGAATASGAPATAPASGAGHGAASTTAWGPATKALAGACAALLTLGIVGVGLRADSDHARTRVPASLAAPPVVEGFTVTRPPEAAAFSAPTIPAVDEFARSAPVGVASVTAPPDPGALPQPQIGDAMTITPPAQPTPAPPSNPQPSPAPSPTPAAQIDASVGGTSGLSAAVGIGDGSCTGLAVGGTGTECAAPDDPNSTKQVEVDVAVAGLPPVSIGL